MKYDHEVIRDLMPLCVDGIASEKSEAIVKEHIAECEACAAEWAGMQQGEPKTDEEPVPESTVKYAETAKRIRKHNRLVRFFVFGFMLLTIPAALILVHAPHGHITLKGMITKYARASEADRYETREAYKNASPAKITYLGDVKSADGKAAAAYCRIYLPSTDDTFLMTLTADRSDPLAFGIWNCTGDEAGEIVKDMGVYSVFNMSPYKNHTKFLWTVGFYSSDPAVTTIRVTANGKENTLTLDERHFVAFRIPDTENDATEKAPNEILTEGEALDQNGNVLYRMQAVEKNVLYGGSYYEIEWIKV